MMKQKYSHAISFRTQGPIVKEEEKGQLLKEEKNIRLLLIRLKIRPFICLILPDLSRIGNFRTPHIPTI